MIVGVAVGARDESGARALWDSLAECYREEAFCHTDFWKAYERVIPSEQHEAVGKESGRTSLLERFNLTARQRISRSVRKTLGFSEKLESHIGANWLFVHHYNATFVAG